MYISWVFCFTSVVFQENFTGMSILYCTAATSGAFQKFLKRETMGKREYDSFRYSYTLVTVFGILGNILVILAILRQRKHFLKNNHYRLVLHLAICDLASLIFFIHKLVKIFWPEESLPLHFRKIYCYAFVINVTFQFAGVGMMLIISLLRYRSVVQPLKPAISRRN